MRNWRRKEPETDPDWLEDHATLYAAAVIIHDNPRCGVQCGLLEMSEETAMATASAADDVTTVEGQHLLRALDGPHNTLHETSRTELDHRIEETLNVLAPWRGVDAVRCRLRRWNLRYARSHR